MTDNSEKSLEEWYTEYAKAVTHHTIIEARCLKSGCEGDIYRAHIAEQKKFIEEQRIIGERWEHRAAKAEAQLEEIMKALKTNMIFKPTDNWQWGYRSGLLAILDVIRPEEGNERSG